jgi:WD40 repeat protein/transcriptional regulator with XRE-family HTH domain
LPISIPSATLEKFTTFGDLLRFLRRRVSLTQMELAIAVGYSHTQISRLEQNLRLPDIPTIEANFVLALGLEEEPRAVARLLELAANVRREDAPAPGLCPYKGLNFYDEADADLFVGREALTSRLVERVLSLATNDEGIKERFFAIVGASGSGKSSLVRAGLVPALRWDKTSNDWQIHVFTPTEHPLESLAATLTHERSTIVKTETLITEMAQDSRALQYLVSHNLGLKLGGRLLLVVDQFEELFALCRLEEEKACFIQNLLSAASEADGPVLVVITIRADFYAHCAGYPQLRDALARQQHYIGAMTDEELRRAIEEAAQRGRWDFEPGLVDLLMRDVGHEPGALPLLSHALLETWQRRRGRRMTLSGYSSSHGVRGAIAETAETVFTDQFTREQQAIARRIFLRLTELNDETSTADTRRRARFDELILKPEEADITQAVLKALADARLITTNEDSAEVAHEALIREWPTLRGWLEDNRDALRLHRQLTETAQEWLAMERSPDMLFRGARLAQTREWASAHDDEMNMLEREFLSTSTEASGREAEEREAQRQRELEVAQRLAETQNHAAKQLRHRAFYLTGVLAVAILATLAAGIFASRNSSLAAQNASIAETAQANFTRSEAQRLAVEANNLILSNEDPSLIALLAIRSLQMRYTPSGDAALTNLTNLPAPPREFKGHTDGLWAVTISPDGRYLATGSEDKTARLWDLATGQTLRIFSGHTAGVGSVAFSPDGKYLMTGSDDRTVRLWDVATGQTVQEFPGQIAETYSLMFSPDGRKVLTTGPGFARVWEVATGKTVHLLSQNANIVFYSSAYSPDGKYILTGSSDHAARLWNAVTGEQIKVFSHPTTVGATAFSPDGKSIATGADDNKARLWDLATGQMLREFSGHQQVVENIKFSPDGQLLLTGSDDRTARLWDVATGKELRVFRGQRDYVNGVLFSPDGGTVVTTAGHDPVVRVWGLKTSPGGMEFYEPGGLLSQASFSPDGKQVVTASDNNMAHIWDAATGQMSVTLRGHSDKLRSAVFSPDGKMILTTSADKTARLWDASSGKEMLRFEGHTDRVNQGIFSPDGKYIITTSYDGTARVWDIQTAQTILVYRNQGPDRLNCIAFSPDGKTVVTSGDDGTARIWDPFTGKETMIFKAPGSVAGVVFSPDGTSVVGASFDGSIPLWEVATGKEVLRLSGDPGGVYTVAFSPDGKFILSGGVDGVARLWDVQTGQEIRRFTGPPYFLSNVTFSPDGKYILTASQDGTAQLWLTDLDDTIRAVCALLTRDLTSDERILFGISDSGPTCPA